MDEHQENERFDVDNDYEGGEWIEDEFYYRNKRRKRSQNKEDAIYGVFAEDHDNDSHAEDYRKGGRGKRENYSKPVNFVGGGVIAPKQLDEEIIDDAMITGNNTEDDNEDAMRGGLGGLGARNNDLSSFMGLGSTHTRGGGGLGFRSGGTSRNNGIDIGSEVDTSSKDYEIEKEVVDNDNDDDEFLPSAFGRKIKQAADRRRQQSEQQRQDELKNKNNKKNSLSSHTGANKNTNLPHSAATSTGVDGIGQFEAHTKGIGAKLLAKMGWQAGKGLGKDGKGIAKPLEAKMRPKGMGMGFGDRREPKLMSPSVPKKSDKKYYDVEIEREKTELTEKQKKVMDLHREAKLWKRKNIDARIKRTFKTADEILEEDRDDEERGKRKSAVDTRHTIIDMRGPQARVVKNLEHLHGNEENDDDDTGYIAMPELQHNIKLLVDITENDIQRLDARLHQSLDTKKILQKEKERLDEERQITARTAQRMEALLITLQQSSIDAPTKNLAELRAVYAGLKAHYQDEYTRFNISAVALAAAMPLFAKEYSDWIPLEDPQRGISEMNAWRPLLDTSITTNPLYNNNNNNNNPISDINTHSFSSHSSFMYGIGDGDGTDLFSLSSSSNPYITLITEIILPPLRRDLMESWNPHDSLSLERIIDAWEKVVPRSVLGYIMVHSVLPRLKSAAENWDPLRDVIPPHAWLHPWLPYLNTHLNEIWPIIRFKFSSALSQWHPADTSAIHILLPWHKVFSEKEWEQLLSRSILPKLSTALSEFTINPADHQDLEPFEWVMAWNDLMPKRLMVALLESHFFPKWYAVLRHWLSGSPDYDEVAKWYLGWKTAFPQSLLDIERVKIRMNEALNCINKAADGITIQPTWTKPKEGHFDHQHNPPAAPVPSLSGATVRKNEEELSLKDLIERYAEEVGVEFAPKLGRKYEGLDVYHFGLVSCVVDVAAQMIRGQFGPTEWRAVSMEGLLEEHRRREREKNEKKKKGAGGSGGGKKGVA